MKNFYFKIKNFPFLILLVIILFSSFQKTKSQNISEEIVGQNAWMPYSIGSTIYYGKLDSQWNKVKQSGAKVIRYGGVVVDRDMPTNTQYLNIIDSIRSNGMEPVIEIPFYNNKYTALQAAEIVQFINVTKARDVKYWVIGNEPDIAYGLVNSAQVADYIKSFSLAMKTVDPSIKIIAPETAWYNQNIINGLTTPGGESDITGQDSLGNFIVDIISFHIYPFSGQQTRSNVISYLSEAGHIADNITQLNQRIAACNVYHQRSLNSPLRIAITEANINWRNPLYDGVFGVGANSFLGGQFWAEMIGICMKKNVDFISFWSIIEGAELGYLYHSTTLPKPTYYHFQLLADNFKGIYCNGSTNQSMIKSFGSKSTDQIAVIILNQDQSNDFIYTLRLDNNPVSGINSLKININAGTAVEYSDTAYKESTILLVFNTNGALLKKCIYKLYGNADNAIPPTCVMGQALPQVQIISPLNNASFNEGSSILIQAVAIGGTGEIKRVEFFADSTKLGEDTTSPYSFTWNNVTSGVYSLTAKATDSINNTSVSAKINIVVAPPQAFCADTGTITREIWYGAGGISVSDIPLNTAPNFIGNLSVFESPQDFANNYGQRLRGYICPPYTGNYIFWIASDNNSELWLSTDDNPGNKTKIASVSGKTFFRQWLKYDSQQSDPKYLVAGQQYYIEALHKESIGKDNLSVGWQLPDGIKERPIPGSRLIPYIKPLKITITSPVNNNWFIVDSSIVIQATTSGGTGSVQKVEFFADSIKLGEDTSSPYSFTWNNAATGNYSLIAKAMDSVNNSAVSGAINITVINPLTVTISAPANGSFFSTDSSIAIQAEAAGGMSPLQKVEFFASTTKLGEDATSPYRFTWNNSVAGNYSITAKVTDSVNNTAVSEAIAVTVFDPLTVTLISPSNSSSFNAGAVITIQATAAGGIGSIQKVEFFAGTTKLGEDTTSPYSFTWNNAAAGTYLLTAKAIDSANDTIVASTVTIIVKPIPICSVTGNITREFWANISGYSVSSVPVNTIPTSTGLLTVFEGPSQAGDHYGSRIRGYICPPITGNYVFWIASDNSSQLWLSTNDQPANKIKIASVSGYTASREWTKYSAQQSVLIHLTAGSKYYIEAIHIEDTQGDNLAVGWQLPNGIMERPIPGSRLSQYIVPLTTTIIAPLNNSSFIAGTAITIQAAVSGGTAPIQKVEFFAGSTKLGEDTTSPYSFTWSNAGAGTHLLTAKVTDGANNTAISPAVTLTVNPVTTCSATGNITREVWYNVGGTSASAIPVSTAPNSTTQLSVFQSPSNIADNYGQRIRGYVCPPVTGNYIFWIASDDNGELWLSSNNNPANKQKIASVPGWTFSKEWTKYSAQQSVSKYLVAGQKYYIEALHKEGSQGDNCAVGWQLPNGIMERPIPGIRLSPYVVSENNIPSVTITSPLNNSVYSPPANITIAATAFVSGGSIIKVEFFQGNTKIGEDLTAPYSYTWLNVTTGNYALKAIATGNTGQTIASQVVNITLGSCFTPLITASGPTNVCSGSVVLNSSVGTGYIYQWKKNGVSIEGATAASYTATSSGYYQVKIIQGACVAWSAPTTVTIQSGLRAAITPGGATTFCQGSNVKLYANTCAGFVYQWRKDGVDIYGANSPIYFATTSGNYQVRVSQNGINAWSALVPVTVQQCFGLNDNEESDDQFKKSTDVPDVSGKFQIKVYPNPTTGRFSIAIYVATTKQQKVEMRIVNILGQEVYKKETVANSDYLKESVELDGSLPPGVYTLQVTIGSLVESTSVVLSKN